MTDLDRILAEWFGVRPAAGKVAAALYEANGAVLSHEELQVAAGQTTAGLAFSLRQLREAMEPDAIGNLRRRGFFMTAVGLADCDRGLVDAAQRATAA